MSKKNGELKIEKGIPLPLRGTGITGLLKQMECGDSLVIPSSRTKNAHNIAYACFGKGNYATRTVEGGLRVWRIK